MKDDVYIKELAVSDTGLFKSAIHLFEEVFDMRDFQIPEDRYLASLLEKEDFIVLTAMLGNKVVGCLTAYTLAQYYSKSPLVYVYDLAVKSEYQRQGIGTRLMGSITALCRDMGGEEVFVQADQVDDYALDFYRSTGARAERVVHFTYAVSNHI